MITHKKVYLLKRALVKSWDEICEETVRATCSQVSSRLRHLIWVKGGYFE